MKSLTRLLSIIEKDDQNGKIDFGFRISNCGFVELRGKGEEQIDQRSEIRSQRSGRQALRRYALAGRLKVSSELLSLL
jgi:hypothetical protein